MLYELEQVVNKVFNDYTFPKVRTVGYINGHNHYEKDGSIFIEINLNQGSENFECYTCDFTHDYIDINADYRS